MPASYKLRLGDGTLLVVDHDGLSNWLVDNKAMVQLVGSSHWRPLKAFLAAERAAARNAARQRPSDAVALPLIPPPPRKEEPPLPAEPPPSEPVEPLSVVEPPAAPVPVGEPLEAVPPIPPPRREEAPPQAEPTPSEPVEPLFVGERPAAQAPLGEPPSLRAQLDAKAGEALPPIPPPREEEAPLQAEPTPSEPVEPLFVGELPAAEVPLGEPATPVRTRLASKADEALSPISLPPEEPIPPPRREKAPRQAEAPPSEPVEPLFVDEPPAAPVPQAEPAAPIRTRRDSKAGEALSPIPLPRKEPIPPPPRKEAPLQAEPPPSEPVEPLFVGEPPAAQVPLREPAAPVRTRLDSKAGEALSPIPRPRKEPVPPPRRKEAPRQPEPPPSEPDEPLFRSAPPAPQVLPESVEPVLADKVADAAWSAEAERRLDEVLPGGPAVPGETLSPLHAEETPRPEAEPPQIEPVEPLLFGEPPAVPVLPESVEPVPADEGAVAAWYVESSRRLGEVPPAEPAAPVATGLDLDAEEERPLFPPLRREETPRQAAPPPSDPVEEPLVLGESPDVPILADRPVVPPAESVWHEAIPNQHVASIPEKPVDDAAYNPPAASSWSEPSAPSVGAQPNLRVLADDFASPHSANTVEKPPVPIEELPIIRLKPLDDDQAKAPDVVRPAAREVQPWADARDDKFVGSVAAFGGFLSVWLGRLERALGWLSSLRPQPAPYAAGKSAAVDAPPSVRTQPKQQVLAEEPTEPHDAFTRGSSWPDQVLATPPPKPSGNSLAPQDAPSKPQMLRADPDPREPFRAPPPISEPVREHDAGLRRPHEPLKAPPSISELPTLRLAEIDEPKAASDVYEGDVYGGESLIRTAWRWTKPVVVITALLAGGTLAALTWGTWSPKAKRLSRTVFTEIDKRARSRELTERRERALQEAAEQLPHLAPHTIELVLSNGVLDPPDVFRLACDAADRGLSALAPAEAQELKALRQELLETLRPAERQRAREYDGARGRRLTLPFEDKEVLELVARGARALPPASRVRLQLLSGKAIAAGLAQDPPLGQPRPRAD